MINFVKPTEESIYFIADNMRHADAVEVMSSHGHTPIEALMNAWNLSDYSVIITVNGIPAVIYGVCLLSVVTGAGLPWMLSAERAVKYKKSLLKYSPPVVDDMLKVCSSLSNHVHVDNKLSVRWLKWLGFSIEEPTPYGVRNELFHRFHLER